MRHMSKFGGLKDKKKPYAGCAWTVFGPREPCYSPLVFVLFKQQQQTGLGPRQFLFPDALNFGTALSNMYVAHGREPRVRIGHNMAIKEFHWFGESILLS